MSFSLVTVFLILVVLTSLGLIGATIMVQPMRESLVASTNLSVVDKGYLSAFLGTIAELINRLILPVLPFGIIAIFGLLFVGLPLRSNFQLDRLYLFFFVLLSSLQLQFLYWLLLLILLYLNEK